VRSVLVISGGSCVVHKHTLSEFITAAWILTIHIVYW